MLDVKQLLGEVVQSVKQAKFTLAATQLATIIEHKPDLHEDWLGISKLALLAGEVELAKKALTLFKKRPNSKLNIDMAYLAALIEVGEFKSAVDKAENLFKDNQTSPEVSHFLSTVYLQLGQRERAAEYAQITLSQWPLAGEAWLLLVNATDMQLESDIFKKMLGYEKEIVAKANNRSKSSYLAALCKVYEDNKNLELAFTYATKSKQVAHQNTDFEPTKELAYVGNIIASTSEQGLANEIKIHSSKQSPIFIVGLPRSGSTLLEQMLCSHSKIVDGGEFNGMERAARALTGGRPIGESVEQFKFSSEQLEDIKRVYLNYAHKRFGSEGIIVDKSLNNNRFVWLIREIFPDSPIIFLHRQPIDSAWSCFKTHFSQGLKWSTTLADIADYFAGEFSLYEHWNKRFGATILNTQYENLVNNTEHEITRIVEYCNLSFEPAMLEFFNNSRPIFTASAVQAKRKMYSTSISSGKLDVLLAPFLAKFK
jgi:tetratricopeptide (TPR) repeat protein